MEETPLSSVDAEVQQSNLKSDQNNLSSSTFNFAVSDVFGKHLLKIIFLSSIPSVGARDKE